MTRPGHGPPSAVGVGHWGLGFGRWAGLARRRLPVLHLGACPTRRDGRKTPGVYPPGMACHGRQVVRHLPLPTSGVPYPPPAPPVRGYGTRGVRGGVPTRSVGTRESDRHPTTRQGISRM